VANSVGAFGSRHSTCGLESVRPAEGATSLWLETAMSLHARKPDPIPEETARVARAAFPDGNLYVRMRGELDGIYADEDFADLFPTRGRPAEAPWRLALVTLFQFAEHLSDRAAADAVRSRIDWKYALSLELTDAGFGHTVLSEFRTRLLIGGAERRLLDLLLRCARDRGLLMVRGRQRTDSTQVLAAVRALHRVELVAETIRHALAVLADRAPDWLHAHGRPEWAERYEQRPEDDRLPSKQAQRLALAETIGRDGLELLVAVDADAAPSRLRDLPALRVLRTVWIQNYLMTETGVRWRTDKEGLPPAARFISSPYDTDVHYAKKRTTHGRRAQGRASMPKGSRSTGAASRPRVRRGAPASAGPRPSTGASTTSSRSSARRRTAAPAPTEPTASGHARHRRAGPPRSVRTSNTTRCGRREHGSGPRRMPPSMLDAPASKAPSPRPCVALGCVARATSASLGRTWVIS
jgi:transposase